MDSEFWGTILKETYRFTWTSYLIVLLPLISFFIVFFVYRKKPIEASESWRQVGVRWQNLGIALLSSLIFAIVISVTFSYGPHINWINGLILTLIILLISIRIIFIGRKIQKESRIELFKSKDYVS